MKSLLENLNTAFKDLADANRAREMSRYMRDQFSFFGISRPEVKRILKQQLKREKIPKIISPVLYDLWSHHEREMQYAAIELIKLVLHRQPASFIQVLEHLILQKSWWDTVDALAVLSGAHLKRHSSLQPTTTNRWINENNIWLQRTAILHQLKYGSETDFHLLQKYVLKVGMSNDFFIQKASGWALRQYGKFAPVSVSSFIESNSSLISALAKREALRNLKF